MGGWGKDGWTEGVSARRAPREDRREAWLVQGAVKACCGVSLRSEAGPFSLARLTPGQARPSSVTQRPPTPWRGDFGLYGVTAGCVGPEFDYLFAGLGT